MGFSLGKALGTIATGGISLLAGSDGSKVGNILNGITGATSAGKTNQKYAKELAAINQKYALESMKKQFEYERSAALNAHQWEMADYDKAGLNPILSAGGSGASADVGLNAGSGSPGSMQAGGAMAADLVNSLTSAGKMSSEVKLANAQTIKTIEESKWIPEKTKAEIANLYAQTYLNNEQAATEIHKRNLIDLQGLTEKEKAKALELSNILDAADVAMFDRIGITRRELIDLGKSTVTEILGLFKAGKYSQALEKVNEAKKNLKKPQTIKRKI